MATQAERRERTRAAIVDNATALFVSHGYSATSITDILKAAEVSRGALYHHFDSKEDVFAAVYAVVSSDAVERATRRSRAAESRLDVLIRGCLAWLDIAAEPNIAQVLFVDGPAALGWERCRDLEDAASLGKVRGGLVAAQRAGEIDISDIELTSRAINAALTEVALAMHRRRPPATRAAGRRTVTALISGLATSN